MMQALNNDVKYAMGMLFPMCAISYVVSVFSDSYTCVYYLSPLLFLPSFVRFTLLFEVMRTLNIEKGKWTKVLNH